MGRSASLVLVLLSACPGLPGAGGMDASTADPVTAYCGARAAANYEWSRRCEVWSEFAPPPIQDDCAALKRPLLRAGAVSFDADAGARCVDAIAAQSCDSAAIELLPPCVDVFPGTGAANQRCGTCGAGLMCSFSAPTCGTCIERPSLALPGLGERCTSPAVDGSGCAPGLACDQWTGSELRCQPYAQVDERCDDRMCAMGSSCRAADGGSTCHPLSERGESCAKRFDCKGGLRCVAGTCENLLAQGESCATFEDCATGRCFAGTCAALFVGLGDSCSDANCKSGLVCSVQNICVIPLPVGASCSEEICESGSSCVRGVCFNGTLACQ